MSPKPFENRIQDLVYNVDVGIGLRLTQVLLYILFVISIAVVYQFSEFKGLKHAEAMDFAQLGRSLATRGEMVTQYIRPASLWFLKTHGPERASQIENHPDIVHPPVYPAVLALGFKIARSDFTIAGPPRVFPPERLVVLPINHLACLLTGLFIFLLANRLFARREALVATTAFFLSNAVWANSISGTGISLAMLWVTGAGYFAVCATAPSGDGAPARPRWGYIALAVIFTALALLTRYGTVALVPALALFIGWRAGPRGWIWGLGFGLAVLLAVSPWLMRNQAVSGSPLGLAAHTALNETNLFPDDAFERSFEPSYKSGAALRALQSKWLGNMAAIYSDHLRTVGNGLFICLFMAAFFYQFVRPDVNAFRWSSALGLVLLMALAGYYGESCIDLLHVFLPVVLIYGTAFFFLLLDRLQLRLRALQFGVIGILLLLGALPLLITLLPPRVGIPYPPYFPPYISHVSKLLAPNELMCSDMPWANAWYGQRDTVHLPVTLDDFYKIHDYEKRFSGLYLTNITRDKPYIRTLATGPYRSWFPILQGQTPRNFPLLEGFPLRNLDQLFLTDRVRWGG